MGIINNNSLNQVEVVTDGTNTLKVQINGANSFVISPGGSVAFANAVSFSNTVTFSSGFANLSSSNSSVTNTLTANTLVLSGSYRTGVVTVAANNIDCSLGNFFTRTATGAISWTVSNVPATGAYSFLLELTNGGTGTQTWMTNNRWPGGTAPTLTTSGVDVLGFITDDGGVNWRGVLLMKDSK
jgi:hypothetical protein